MKNQTFFDCIILVGTAVSLNLPEMQRPVLQDVFTTYIKLSLNVEEVIINGHLLEMDIAFLLNQNWMDPRLNSNIQTRKLAVNGKIWEPKITNIYGIQSNENLDDTLYWRGYGEGNITLNKKYKLRIICTKNLKEFPFDTQFCQMKFGSYRFPMEEVFLKWVENTPSITVLNKLKYSEFYLTNVSTNIMTDIRATGNFSSAVVIFTIKRNPKSYFICTGIPCITMIFLSYISMWIKKERKVHLNYLSLCSHSYFFYSSTCLLYPVPYFKSLDIFVGLSFIFSLFAFIVSIVDCNEYEINDKNNYTRKSWFIVSKRIGYPFLYMIALFVYYKMYFK